MEKLNIPRCACRGPCQRGMTNCYSSSGCAGARKDRMTSAKRVFEVIVQENP